MNRLSVVVLCIWMALAAAAPPPASPPTDILPTLDNQLFFAEDSADYALAREQELIPAARIARVQDVSFSLENSGHWETLASGERVWSLRVVSPGATDLILVYDQWRIPKPCELWIYDDARTTVLGPFTYLDNWSAGNITPLTPGDAVTLEYHVPADQDDAGELSIFRVLHGYRNILNRDARERDPLDAFGDALDCMQNVVCFPEYAEEKNAVAMIIDPSGGICSGTMLNTTAQDGEPLFLTSAHCLNGNQENWLFYFNYESPQCDPSLNGSMTHVIANATLLASHVISDHALLRLSHPRPVTDFIPNFAGWYRPDIAPQTNFAIHHPRADVKKAHYDNGAAISSSWNGQNPNSHWRNFPDIGTAEPGSSGSPMFNQNSRVVGTLHGGLSSCEGSQMTVYGKLAVAWEGGGTSATRLRDWLDPQNSGAEFVDSFQPVPPVNDSCGAGVPHVTELPFEFSGSTLFALNHSQSGCAANTAGDVLFTLELSEDYDVTVSTCGSEFDTQLGVFETSGCAQDGGIQVACNEDFCETQSRVSFIAQANTFYTIRLDGYASASGNYVLSITGDPLNSALPAPGNLVIVPQIAEGNVLLRWNSVAGASSYTIFASEGFDEPCSSRLNFVAMPSDTYYVDAGALLFALKQQYCVLANR
ncbi:MAG: trypsin-like peptidase domain-containing protein [Calditrichaeota bacterium]|nr:trypsin-like peptidase domain-containing protein [Calditrichota bacterium]